VVISGTEYEEGYFTKIGDKAYERTRELKGTDLRRKMSEEITRHIAIRLYVRDGSRVARHSSSAG
jgi:hypothetical protein